jgi:hypothetical protein
VDKVSSVSISGERPVFTKASPRTGTSGVSFDACRAAIAGEMPRLLADLFGKVDAMHKDFADKTSSDGRYAAYADAMRTVYERRGGIEARFLAGLEKSCDSSDGEIAPGLTSGEAEPALAELDPARAAERHEELVLDNLVTKAENRYSDQLGELRRWIAARRPGVDVGHPLSPREICAAFHASLQPLLGLDLSIKLVLYKLFDRQVMDRLEPLYERCLRGAESARGALPGGTRTDSSHRAAPSTGSAARRPASTAGRSGTSASVAGWTGISTPSFDALCRALTLVRPKDHGAGGAVGITLDALREILFRLERDVDVIGGSGSDAERLLMRFRAELDALGGNGIPRRLTQEQAQTLELVFRLFDVLLGGAALEDAVKDLIARLRLPVARLVLEDKGFFENRLHPARQLINHLAASALGWVDDGERGAGTVPGRIESVVGEVLNDRGRDPRLYTRLDSAFRRLVAAEQNQARDAEERARQEIEDREKRHGAEAVVRRLVAKRLNAWGEVPAVVSSLVYEGWEQVMLSAYREGGTCGEAWALASKTLDRLLWSVQPKLSADDRRELLRGIPELLRALREALGEVDYDQRRIAAAFRELQALHLTALRPADPDRRSASGEAPSPAGGGALPDSGGKLPRALFPGRYLGPRGATTGESPNVNGLREGTWLEVRSDRETVRVKLAWRGAASDIHLFVDRRGRKFFELSETDLDDLFARGAAKILVEADRPIVDLAIEALARSLGLE